MSHGQSRITANAFDDLCQVLAVRFDNNLISEETILAAAVEGAVTLIVCIDVHKAVALAHLTG